MIKKLESSDILIPCMKKERFDLDTKTTLAPYVDINYAEADYDETKQFFENQLLIARTSMGLAHCIHHDLVSRLMVYFGDSIEAKENVFSKKYNEITGGWTGIKRADECTLIDNKLNGMKKWITNIHNSSYVNLQILDENKVSKSVYVDLTKSEHEITFANFTPLGMELAIPGSIIFKNIEIKPDQILGLNTSPQFFLKNNFHSYCFLTNHLGVTRQLFLDLKAYTDKFDCGAEFDIKKLETDVCTMQMQWEDNLISLKQRDSTNEFWHRRNTQYSFSKKTLISIIQMIIEVGVSYWANKEGDYSQRFRDALTYSSHMYPLYRFSQLYNFLELK